ncbi:hypothetical protein MKX03_016373, partial [Papaver bracteatum]
ILGQCNSCKTFINAQGILIGWSCLVCGALALDLPITASYTDHGLVPPATAIALMGKGGSVLLLTMLF